MQYQGLVLSLDTFDGDVILEKNSFIDNQFQFESCDVQKFDQKGLPEHLAEVNLTDNFDTVLKHEKDAKFNMTQIKSLIQV
jgi:hypothetical protein